MNKLFKVSLLLVISLSAFAENDAPPTLGVIFKRDFPDQKNVLKNLEKSFSEHCASKFIEKPSDADFVLLIDAKGFNSESYLLSYTLLEYLGNSSLIEFFSNNDSISEQVFEKLTKKTMIYIMSWPAMLSTNDPKEISNHICESYKENYEVIYQSILEQAK